MTVLSPRGRFHPIYPALCVLLAILLPPALRADPSSPPAPVSNFFVLSLNGEWEFRQAGQAPWLKAWVPGTVHQDLIQNLLIPDPFYRDNEKKVQWVEDADWEYRRAFNCPDVIAAKDNIELVCAGLDTFAAITLNGAEVGRADNMFRVWRFDVKPLVKPGVNELRIVFDSPVRREKEMESSLSHKLPGNAPHSRKAPYSFGWDWGPRLATSGVWRAIGLEAWNKARIADLRIEQDHSQTGMVSLKVEAEILADREMRAELRISVDGPKSAAAVPVSLAKGANRVRGVVRIKDPKLWWPAGMGDQNLYILRAGLFQDGTALHGTARRLGLRTMELVQDKDDWGHSFYFRVNGIPFFAKGGNWIPADSFLPRMHRDRYKELLRSCREANMNMLRVWGGGIYESDDFYDLCDELGLVVWQDFMFACQMVPGDEAFLDNVRAEAEGVVKALRHHASLGLWCGNNECEEGWFHWGWKESLPASAWEDYLKVFDGILPEAVGRLDPGRVYWPSSPHTLDKTGEPRSEESGDMHDWGVWHGQEPFEEYRNRNHRFFSEFGFQSFPGPDTIEAFTRPEDRNITSPVMERHQKHPAGNRLITLYMLDHYRFPKDFDSLLWLSQVLQAEGMKIAAEHFRSRMPRVMGSLYWQINDCWPAASWSGMDYHGRWKALPYYARRFYSPVLITAIPRNDTLVVSAVSDERQPRPAEFRWSLRTYAGRVVREESRPVTIEPGRSVVLMEAPLVGLQEGFPPEDIYVHCELVDGSATLSANVHHFSRLKRVDLPDPRITASVVAEGSGAAVELRSEAFAKSVHLEVSGCPGRFEDNVFDMLPGRSYRVRFLPAEGADLARLKDGLKVRSLRDSY